MLRSRPRGRDGRCPGRSRGLLGCHILLGQARAAGLSNNGPLPRAGREDPKIKTGERRMLRSRARGRDGRWEFRVRLGLG